MRPIDWVLVFIACVAVSVADVLLKQVAVNQSNFLRAVISPLMGGVLALYAFQIGIFLWVFVKKAELGLVGIAQNVIYAVIVLGAAALFFNEGLSTPKIIGTVLALAGIFLMNFSK